MPGIALPLQWTHDAICFACLGFCTHAWPPLTVLPRTEHLPLACFSSTTVVALLAPSRPAAANDFLRQCPVFVGCCPRNFCTEAFPLHGARAFNSLRDQLIFRDMHVVWVGVSCVACEPYCVCVVCVCVCMSYDLQYCMCVRVVRVVRVYGLP